MKLEQYQQGNHALPDQTLAWNMYGKGLESIGRNGEPESFELPEPSDDQMLVRVDSVGMCFSDVKLIRQGGSHPKLYNRDLTQEPTRLGHEAAITVIKVGKNLEEQFSEGDRLAVQPDIYQNGKSTAYGYTIPGGLIQYHLMGAEMLDTDAGVCLLPLDESLGYAETALLEPWGCVMASYTQRRRLTPKAGGLMWIRGGDADREYSFSSYLDAPARIILTDVTPQVDALVRAGSSAEIIVRDGAEADALSAEFTDGKGFDDIVVLAEGSADAVSAIAKHIARRGTMNLVHTEPLDGLIMADVGRLHYDYIAYVGTKGTEISASYGEERNRCELAPNGSMVVVGAGGPMGQMHVQRALELPNGPKLVIATDINDQRLRAVQDRYGSVAEDNERRLVTFNPMTAEQSLHDVVMAETDQKGAEDVVISVPSAKLMEDGAKLMSENGMLVLFAGVPNGTLAPVDVSNVYLNNMQYTGTSGLTIHDQAEVMSRTLDGSLSPSRLVAAIGGIEAAKDGVEAMMESRFPGKIVIFPQISGLPLMGLDELEEKLPEIGALLGAGNTWTPAAEKALLEKYL